MRAEIVVPVVYVFWIAVMLLISNGDSKRKGGAVNQKRKLETEFVFGEYLYVVMFNRGVDGTPIDVEIRTTDNDEVEPSTKLLATAVTAAERFLVDEGAKCE